VTGARPAEAGTSMIGRGAELQAVADAFAAGAHLVTLVGLGGIGKTTIAATLAGRPASVDPSISSAPFVDLAPVRESADVLAAIAGSLAVSGVDEPSIRAAVTQTLGHDPTLLILDNFEHVLPARELVGELLSAVEGLRILVTSRVAIGLTREQVIPVSPLELPGSVDQLDQAPAARLFLRRVRELGGVEGNLEADGPAIVEICRRMDGVPLALELAAGWAPLLSPRAILRRLDDRRLRLVGSGNGRHATMDRVVDTTLELLDPADRWAFDALSIFVAPFDEPGAQAVLATDDVLPILRRLDAAGLLQPIVDTDGEPRFRILEPVRTVGEARRTASHDARAIERRFVGQAAARAQAAADRLRDAHPNRALGWMATEQPNLRAALAAATSAHDAPAAVQLAMTLATFGVRAGNARQSLHDVRAAMDIGPVPAGIRSEALCAIANLSTIVQEGLDVGPLCREAVELARSVRDGRRMVRAQIAAGMYGPRAQSVEVLVEALEFARSIGYGWAVVAASDNLANVYLDAGRWRDALDLLERRLAERDANDDETDGSMLATLADLKSRLGQAADGYPLAMRAARLDRTAWPRSAALVFTLSVAATCEILTDRVADAARTLVEACETAEASAASQPIHEVFETGIHVLADDRPEIAARLSGFIDGFAARLDHSRAPNPITTAALARVRRSLGPRAFEREATAGRAARDWTLLREVRSAAAALADESTRAAAEFGMLTPREMDVLGLLAQGRTDGEISIELGMSPKTASVHVASIKSKLGAATRIDAAMRAREIVARRQRPSL
jgi:predicted ATPase/DNA-binding CsgD family transcriptional regulator